MLKRLTDRLEKMEFRMMPRLPRKEIAFVNYNEGEDPREGWRREHGPDVPFPDPDKFMIIGFVTPDPQKYAKIREEDEAMLAEREARDAEALGGKDNDVA